MNKKWKLFLIPVLLCMSMFILITHPKVVYADETGQMVLKILQVPLFAQQTPNWCWAASGEMIMDYLGREVPQCLQVGNILAESSGSGSCDCCQKPRPGNCIDQRGWPDYDQYEFYFSGKPGGLSWEELIDQIDSNKPVGFSWKWEDSGSHYMVARGYIILNDIRMVVMNDPIPWSECKCKGGSVKIISYRDYVEFPYRYTHWYDDYNITKK